MRKSYKLNVDNETSQKEYASQIPIAPPGKVLPSVIQCIDRIATLWSYYIKNEEMYKIIGGEFYAKCMSEPNLNRFNSSDDSILEYWARNIERKHGLNIH